MFQPVIKWSGSKRSQSSEIIKYFPKEIDTYYEPFCGGFDKRISGVSDGKLYLWCNPEPDFCIDVSGSEKNH